MVILVLDVTHHEDEPAGLNTQLDGVAHDLYAEEF
jgi:hypothetical protein